MTPGSAAFSVFGARATETPDEVLDYGFDWVDLLEEGETISSSSWETVSGSPATVRDPAVEGSVAFVWVEDLADEVFYTFANTVSTSGGRTMQALLELYARGP